MNPLLLRQAGFRWKPHYPHLRPRCGLPRDQRLTCDLDKFLDNDGFILSSTVFSLHNLPSWDESTPPDNFELISTSGDCYLCDAPAPLWCQQCKAILCLDCWEKEFESEDCCGSIHCLVEPEYTCRRGHHLCQEHVDRCAVCAGAMTHRHNANHTYTIAVHGCTQCDQPATQLCFTCRSISCDECSCACCERVFQADLNLDQEVSLRGWQIFAKTHLAPKLQQIDPERESLELGVHLQVCWEFFDAALHNVIDDFVQSDEEDLDDELADLQAELEDLADQAEALGQGAPAAIDVSDDSDDWEPQTVGLDDLASVQAGTYVIETEAPSGSHYTMIEGQSTLNTLIRLLETNAVASCLLLNCTDHSSSQHGSIRMLCYWWMSESWSLHHVGSTQELLELLDASDREQVFFPTYFLQLKHPALGVGKNLS